MDIIMLKRLYQGELRPEEQYRPRLKSNCEKRKQLRERERALMQKLDENTQREIVQFLDESNLIGFMDMEDVYIQGMQVGARLAMELLGN